MGHVSSSIGVVCMSQIKPFVEQKFYLEFIILIRGVFLLDFWVFPLSFNLCYGTHPHGMCWRLWCAVRHIWVSDTNTDKTHRERTKQLSVSFRQDTDKGNWRSHETQKMIQRLDKRQEAEFFYPSSTVVQSPVDKFTR